MKPTDIILKFSLFLRYESQLQRTIKHRWIIKELKPTKNKRKKVEKCLMIS